MMITWFFKTMFRQLQTFEIEPGHFISYFSYAFNRLPFLVLSPGIDFYVAKFISTSSALQLIRSAAFEKLFLFMLRYSTPNDEKIIKKLNSIESRFKELQREPENFSLYREFVKPGENFFEFFSQFTHQKFSPWGF